MRLTTWNVNGIRNPFAYQPWNTARTYPAMFDILETDIVVMQELKIQRKDLRDDMVILEGWDCYFSLPKHKKGYSGVGIYTRNATCAPIRAEEGLIGVLPSRGGLPYRDLPAEESIGGYPSEAQVVEFDVDPTMLDSEGRCVALEFPAFVLFGVYAPANSNGLRDDFRHGFIRALDCRIRNLVKAGKNVVLVGDLNVSRDERDGASALEDCRKAGMSHEEYVSSPNRRIFNQLLLDGEVIGDRDESREVGVLWDTTRAFHPERKGMYTHWEQKINARPGNYGSRIDFVLVSEKMKSWIQAANTQDGLLGSDHCPVYVDFHDTVIDRDGEKPLLDIMSPPGTFQSGDRQRDWRLHDIPAFSGRRLPEFDKRRSIKSMFSAPLLKTESTTASMLEEQTTENQTAQPKTDLPVLSATLQAASRETSPDKKRKASITAKATPPKRTKSDLAETASKGQQSLKGFFLAKPPSKAVAAETVAQSVVPANTQTSNGDRSAGQLPSTPKTTDSRNVAHDEESVAASTELNSPASTAFTASPSTVEQSFEAREKTNRSWNALFSRPVAPLCESHAEPCKSMLTKKKGSNQGRSFWMCARPLGPSGSKERGTQWRCSTFIWCSDWDAKNGGDKEKSLKTSELTP